MVLLPNSRSLRWGYNVVKPKKSPTLKSVHAEMMAISRLPINRKKKKKISVNLLVIRIQYNGKLKNSKPCPKCMNDIISKIPKKGYKIDRVYHSDDNEDIISSKMRDL